MFFASCATTQTDSGVSPKKEKKAVIDERLDEKPFDESKLEEQKEDYSKLSNADKKRLNRARESINEGNKALKNNDPDMALEFFRKAENTFAKIPETHLGFGQAYYKQNKFKDAEKSFLRAIKYRKGFRMAMRGLGLTYAKMKKPKEAIFTYKALLKGAERGQFAYEYYYHIARAYDQLNNVKLAKRNFQTAIEKKPDYASAYIYMGKMLIKDGQYQNAITVFQTGLKRVPGDKIMTEDLTVAQALFYNFEGARLYAAADYTGAVRNFKKAIAINPKVIDSYISLGNAYIKQKDYANAVDSFGKAKAIEPLNLDVAGGLGRSYFLQKEYKKAREFFEFVLKKDESNYRTAHMLGVVNEKLESYDLAIQYYKHAIKQNENYFDSYINVSGVYMRVWRYDDAVEACAMALSILTTRKVANPEAYRRVLTRRKNTAEAYAQVQKGDKLFDSAIDLMNRNKVKKDKKVKEEIRKTFSQAKGHYESALSKNKDLVAALVSLANVQVQLNDYKRAERNLNRVVGGLFALDANNLSALYTLARLYKEVNRPDDAAAIYKKIQTLQKDNPEPFYQMAMNNEMRGKYTEAIKFYEMALKIKKDYKNTVRHLAVCYFNRGKENYARDNYKGAELLFNKSLEYLPDFEPAIAALKILKDRKNFQKVLEIIKAADKLFDDNKYPQAIIRYQDAIKRVPDIPEVYVSLANAFMKLKRYDEAKKVLEKGLENNKNSHLIYSNMGILFARMKKYNDAIKMFDQAIFGDPKNVSYYNLKGSLYFSVNDFKTALGVFQEALNVNEKDPETHLNMGRVYYKTGDYDMAIVEFNKAIRFSPDGKNTDALFNLGVVLKVKRDFEAAIASFKMVLKEQADNPAAFFHLAHAYYFVDKYIDLAIQNCKKAISLDRKQLVFYWGLANMYEKKSKLTIGKEAMKNVNQAVSFYKGIISAAPVHRFAEMAKQRIADLLPSIYTTFVHQIDSHTPAGATYDEPVFYVGTADGSVRGVDVKTKKLVLAFNSADRIATRIVMSGRSLFFGNESGRIFAIPNRGKSVLKPLWYFQTGKKVSCDPLVDQEHVYVGANDGFVYCLDRSDGRLRWKHYTGYTVSQNMVLSGEHLVFGNANGEITALTRATGKTQWESFVDGKVGKIRAADSMIFLTTSEGLIYALNSSSGRAAWEKRLSSYPFSALDVTRGTLYAGVREGYVFKLRSQSGDMIWKTKTHTAVTSNIIRAAVGGVVKLFFGDKNGMLYCLNDSKARENWRFPLKDRVARIAHINPVSKLIYVSARDGSLSLVYFKK